GGRGRLRGRPTRPRSSVSSGCQRRLGAQCGEACSSRQRSDACSRQSRLWPRPRRSVDLGQQPGDLHELPSLATTHGWARFPLERANPSRKGGGYTGSMAVVERHADLVEELLAEVEAYKPAANRELLTRALEYAAKAHEGQQRASGQEFIYHPFGVAKILAQLQLDEPTLAAALLHDVVEDTDADIDEVRTEFGEEIATLVEGVTKLTRVKFQTREHAEAENYRKLIVAMAEDVRVILIKLAD